MAALGTFEPLTQFDYGDLMRTRFQQRNQSCLRLFAALVVAGLSAAHALGRHDPGYIGVDLGTLGGAQSMALGINKNNEVVGASQTADGRWHAFFWADGQMTDLGVLPGFDDSYAQSINITRQIVGRTVTANGLSSRAFAWVSGNRTDLGTLGGESARAYGINGSRHAVGTAQQSDGQWRAFVWRNNVMTSLGTLPGHTASAALSISDSGLITGWSEDGEGNRIAVYWTNDQIVEIGTLGGLHAEATSANRNGVIVGHGDTGNEVTHPFMWENGQLTDLGAFPVGGDSRAFSINILREAVGEAFLPAANEYQAVLWKPGRTIQNINSLLPPLSGWDTLLSATGISDSGHICGTGRTTAGETHAYLLVPKLGLANPVPGRAGEVNTFDAAGALPHAMVHVVYGFQYGSVPVPGCNGVNFGIRAPTLLRSVRADETGHALFTVMVPQAARNRGVLFQALEGGSCELSSIMIWTFY